MSYNFTSKIPNLTLQDGQHIDPATGKLSDIPAPWAVFVDGVFATDDEQVAVRLRGIDGITESLLDGSIVPETVAPVAVAPEPVPEVAPEIDNTEAVPTAPETDVAPEAEAVAEPVADSSTATV